MKKRIWYAFNLHLCRDNVVSVIQRFETKGAANAWAKGRAAETGCTYAVASGEVFHQGDGCSHGREERP